MGRQHTVIGEVGERERGRVPGESVRETGELSRNRYGIQAGRDGEHKPSHLPPEEEINCAELFSSEREFDIGRGTVRVTKASAIARRAQNRT